MANESQSEVLIIGSGFGGSVAASRLVEAGFDVTMLERGPWRDTVPVRSMGIKDRSPLPKGLKILTHGFRSIRMPLFRKSPLVINKSGFFEAIFGDGLWVFCTSNVGGGSHAYSGLHGKPDNKYYWNNHCPQINSEIMDVYYEQVMNKLGSRQIKPDDKIPCHTMFWGDDEPLTSIGAPNYRIGILLPKDPGSPRRVINEDGVVRWESSLSNDSFLGSESGAKTTLDFAILGPAINNGMKLKDMCEVVSVNKITQPSIDGPRYSVNYIDHKTGRKCNHVARHVILAAGGANTARLLLHSRDVAKGITGMPNLGKWYGGNGDFFAFWAENNPKDLSKSLPIPGLFKIRGSNNKANLMRAGWDGVDNYPVPGFIKNKLRHQSIIVGMGADEVNGQVSIRGGKYILKYDRKINPIYREINNAFTDIERVTDSRIYAFETPITVHPLGGARLGASIRDGVVGYNGEVFDNPGLYVADAAALPAAPGGPPSMTISAWSANVAEHLIRSRK
ncbi:MAG TPA: GMC oxidoreductase [Burkholderiaceae bacterium]|nr:GMC oxidoreductase [Burkholderiaceae bacterium]